MPEVDISPYYISSYFSIVFRAVKLDKVPERCAVAACGSISNVKEGLSLHVIPYYDDDRPEAMKRRKKWIDFVSQKRAKWTPSKRSVMLQTLHRGRLFPAFWLCSRRESIRKTVSEKR